LSSLLSPENWKLLSIKIKSFWEDYRRNKIGLLGLATIILYILVAIFGPWMISWDPTRDTRLAQRYAMPEWITILPQYSDYPRTMRIPIYWNVTAKSELIDASWGEQLKLNYIGSEAGIASIYAMSNFTFPYKVAPKSFHITFLWKASRVKNLTYSIHLGMVNLTNTKQTLWWTDRNKNMSESAFVNSEGIDTLIRLNLDVVSTDLAGTIFSGPGEYALALRVTFMSSTEHSTAEISFSEGELRIMGLVHGLLGVDQYGRDLWSQLITGVRISLIIGLVAAFLSTSIGITVGVVAGYLGGLTDELSMRMVDILLCIPMLPLLLTLMYIYGKSPFYLIIIIALFYWLGLARIIRSQVLSLREMPFIEAAKAAGAGKFYIIFRHLIPNTLPVAFAHMVLAVPGAIILEAALSFLGFGDPATSTWGRMLNHAFNHGAFTRLAWWWIFPPGLAIVFLCMAFVFVGHAVDEIANPRLRRRR